jgi:predicted negative regulator of RcsB-dependent stress response
MAETKDVSKPKEPPKPVQIGGESLVDRILPHMKKIIVVVIISSFVVTVIFGIRWWKHRGQEQETAKIAEAIRVGQRPVAAQGAAPDPKNPAFADPAEREKAILDEMSKQGASPPGHAYRGSVLLGAGQVDQAIEEYKRGQDAPGLEGVLSREGLGIALEAKAEAEKDAAARGKLLEEALAVFKRMQPDEKGPRHVYALYHQGRVLDESKLNRKAEAKAAFEKANEILGTERRHELRDLVQKRLAALGAA